MREPGKLRRVFISSTSVDLRSHRAAVKAAIERMDQHPVVMENFGAQGQGDATSVSREEVAKADLFVLLVAWRYGHVPDSKEFSISYQEYCEALERKLPTFVYLADPTTDGPEHDSPAFPATDRDPEHRVQLDDFRTELQKARIVDYFVGPDELATQVVTALHKYLIGELRAAQARERGVPHDLPPRALGFFGRAQELKELCDELRRGESAGLSALITGMAGVGKSALAAEVVHALAGDRDGDEPKRFPGGITWVRCDTLTGLNGLAALDDWLLAAWSAALPPEVVARAATPEEAVTLREQALRARLRPPVGQTEPEPAFVLLDNLEPDLPLDRALETLTALGIRTLITSRAIPAARGLRVRRLGMLDPAAAITLFAERYVAAEGAWDASYDTEAAAEVVEALGHLPLAVELAAARGGRNKMSVAALAAELCALDVLAKLRDPLDPTAGVRYAFERTVGTAEGAGVLSPTQRARFVALGLLEGADWPRDVIETFLDAVRLEDVEAPSGADDLEALIAVSLVALVTSEADAGVADPARVRLHPLLHNYANELWHSKDDDGRKSDIGHLLTALSPFVAGLRRDFVQLAREETLIGGAARAADHDHAAPQALVNLVTELGDYLYLGGHWRLGMDLFKAASVAAHEATNDRRAEVRMLNFLGLVAKGLGRTEEAGSSYDQALVIARENGYRDGEASTLNNLGTLCREKELLSIGEQLQRGYLKQARRYYEQALSIDRETGDREGQASILSNLGKVELRLDRPEQARSYYNEALAVARKVGNQRIEASARVNLGELATIEGLYDQAHDLLVEALAILRAIGDPNGEATTLNRLGEWAEHVGNYDDAERYYYQALAVADEIGAVIKAEMVLANLDALSEQRAATAAPPSVEAPSQTALPTLEDRQPAPAKKPTKRHWWTFGR